MPSKHPSIETSYSRVKRPRRSCGEVNYREVPLDESEPGELWDKIEMEKGDKLRTGVAESEVNGERKVPWPEFPGNLSTQTAVGQELSKMPCRRKLEFRSGQDWTSPGTMKHDSALTFCVGQISNPPCDNCANGCGPWISCVVVPGHIRGPCAGCLWGQGKTPCSFTSKNSPVPPAKMSSGTEASEAGSAANEVKESKMLRTKLEDLRISLKWKFVKKMREAGALSRRVSEVDAVLRELRQGKKQMIQIKRHLHQSRETATALLSAESPIAKVEN